jgi:hypothetical protein
MSFDIFYQPCRFGGEPVEQKNALTGKVESVLPNEPLTAAELKAVRGVLKKAGAAKPDHYGCYVVELGDGSGAEVFGKDLENGCMVALHDLTPDIIRFLFDLLKAGRWVMTPASEENVAITTSPEQMWGLPDDFPEVVTCPSAEELEVLLCNGYKAWKKFRNQVVRELRQGKPGRDRKSRKGPRGT